MVEEADENIWGLVLMICVLDLYGNIEQGNKPQFQRWDASNILTFFVSRFMQKDGSNNEIIAGKENKLIKNLRTTDKNSLT